jgi:putative ABC transport system permease protein
VNWLQRLVRNRRLEHELDAELRDHLERQVVDHVRKGMSEQEARRLAHLEFGGLDQVKEVCRDARGLRLVDELTQDIRMAVRALRATPIVTAVAVLSLSLGIGANTAIFSLVNSLFFRTLPVKNPEQLLLLAAPAAPFAPQEAGPLSYQWSYAVWDQIRGRPQLFNGGAFAYYASRLNLASGGETDFVDGLWATSRFFDVLGVSAVLGRTFTEMDDQRRGGDAGAVAVIGYGLWQRRFGGVSDVIGRTLTVDRGLFTIVGVLPRGFSGPVVGRTAEIVIPVGTEPLVHPRSMLDSRGAMWLTIMARLKPGQTRDAAAAALQGIQPQIREATVPADWPRSMAAEYLKSPFTLLPASGGNALAPLRVRSERPLRAMQAVVALVLLIACSNIANLMLARTVARRHEMSVRVALGASRWRLVRQLLVESLVVASIGAAGGLLLAQWGTGPLVRFLSAQIQPYPVFLDLTLDVRVLAFTAGVAIAAALLFGTLPALRASGVEPIDALKEQGRSAAGTRGGLANGLVVAQVALSLVLLVGAGLFVRTLANLAAMDLGFDPKGVLVVNIGVPTAGPGRPTSFEAVRRAVAALPDVAGAAMSMMTPVSGEAGVMSVDVTAGVSLPPGQNQMSGNAVGPGWFSVYRTSMLTGRDFTDADRAGARPIAIVNRAFAQKFLNGANPVGHIVRQADVLPGRPPMDWEVVGMVADAVYESLRAPLPPMLYHTFAQYLQLGPPSSASLSIRSTAALPMTLRRGVAAAIADVNPDLALTFRSLPDVVSASITPERVLAIVVGFFGALALLLAALGLYGVTSYTVNRRRGEIGIRMALGASPDGVVRLVLSRVSFLVGAGLLVGGGASVWLSQFVASLLYGLQPRDPLTLAASALTLAAVGGLAGWLPASRASRIDPAEVLRDN